MTERNCPHNPGLQSCTRSNCKLCGWEPTEAKRRSEEIKADGLLRDKDGTAFYAVRKGAPV